MKNSITITLWKALLVVLIFSVVSYLIGRAFVTLPEIKKVTKIEYKKVPYIVRDTLYYPKPYAVEVPVVKEGKPYPVYIPGDTVENKKVWDDYYLTRKYDLDFSNDTLGIFKVDAEVSENKLVRATSSIQPIVKTITHTETIYKVPAVQLWGMIGTSPDFNTNKIQVGIDLKQKIIIGASGIRMNNQKGFTIDLGLKF